MASILNEKLNILNIGLTEFTDALEAQGAKVLHVEWRPPVDDDEEIESLLDMLL